MAADLSNVLNFIQQLKENNNREWFQENKNKYQKARSEFESLVNEIIPAIAKFDSSIGMITSKDCIFRIYRDIRFSKDKTPYKTNFGAYMANGGRKSLKAGYYLHIDPDQSFLGGGLHMPPSDVLKMARKEIYYNVEEFKKILSEKNFRKYYDGLHDYDRLKKAPKDFPADFPDIDILKNKSFLVLHNVSRNAITSDNFRDYVVDAFKAMYPFNKFLNRSQEA